MAVGDVQRGHGIEGARQRVDLRFVAITQSGGARRRRP